MKLISWNVNGIRAVSKKGFFDFLESTDADFICLQEIKITEKDLIEFVFENHEVFSKYYIYHHCAEKRKGYSGVLILAKKLSKLSNVKIGIRDIDIEGRLVSLEYNDFYLINAYFPHSDRSLSRIPYKNEFNKSFDVYVSSLKDKPKILTGDFNVAHNEIDLARPKQNVGNPGFTDVEREWFDKFLDKGYVDTFRYKNPELEKYSWWSYRSNARERNVGWRIDYFLVSSSLQNNILFADINNEITGSDHCPIVLDLDFSI